MAEGITAVYVRTRLEVTEAELNGLIALFRERRTFPEVRVLENGSQEIAFPHESNEGPVLEFAKHENRYVCQASCRVANARLAGALRLAVARFKGNALFHRYGDGFIMAYEYHKGTVVRITEIKEGTATVLYQFNAAALELERLFLKNTVEEEIARLRAEVDRLLDRRNQAKGTAATGDVDEWLRVLAARLHALEG